MKVTVKGIRTSCLNGKKENVLVHLEKYYSKSLESWWIKIVEGNVTGYESFEFKNLDRLCERGWMACMGTKGMWDKLFIPAEEMQKLKDYVTVN
jgi:hypothetical protein